MGIWGRAPSWDKGLLTRLWTLQVWGSLNLFKNRPIDDVQGFSTVSCSLVPFHCSTVQKRPFIKWVLRVVCISLHNVLLHTLAYCPPTIDFGSSMHNGYLRKVLPHEIKAFLPDFGHCKCGDRWTFSRIVQLMMFKASPQCRALSYLSTAPRFKRGPSSSESWG